MYNPDFNSLEFEGIKNEAGLNRFILSVKQWVEKTNSIGIVAKAGRYGGTYAHKDIAFKFASWISDEFELYIIKDYQRLKEDETSKNEFIQPKYEIRFCLESLGNDTLAFVVLTKDLWKQLENEFDKEKVSYYFEEIIFKSKIFDMDVDTTFKIRGERLGIG